MEEVGRGEGDRPCHVQTLSCLKNKTKGAQYIFLDLFEEIIDPSYTQKDVICNWHLTVKVSSSPEIPLAGAKSTYFYRNHNYLGW